MKQIIKSQTRPSKDEELAGAEKCDTVRYVSLQLVPVQNMESLNTVHAENG